MIDNIIRDEMTPIERFTAFEAGKEIDRIPCCPIIGEAATSLIGTTVTEFCHSSKLMSNMEISLYKTFHHDSVGVGPDLFGIAEAMGTVLTFPKNDIPYVNIPIVKHYSDIDKLVPVNPYKDGRLPLFLEAVKMIKDEVGSEVGVGSSVGGPFTTAASLRGTENFLKDMVKNPEAVHKLLRIATESALIYIEALSKIGVKPSIPEPIGSGTVISAKQFRTFVKPYLTMYMDKIIELYGSGPTLHICGNTKDIWEDMADTGAKTLSIDNIVSLEEAKKTVGKRVIIMGNVKPVETMYNGDRAKIFEDVKECLRQAYDSPKGYILSTGCQLPMGTPMENIQHFMDVARIYGKYPVKLENLI